jgi:cytochrome c peroxidase
MLCLLASAGLAKPLEVVIHHRFGDAPLLMESSRYETAAGETFSITRLAYLLSNFSLEREDGTMVPLDEFAFVEAHERSSFSLSSAPSESFRALHFDVGLGPETNHSDPARYAAGHPLNPLLNRLHWDWQGGYIFFALEGHFKARDQASAGYVYHVARDPNRTRMSVAVPMDLRDPGRLHLVLDVEKLVDGPRPVSFFAAGRSTHSNEGDALPSQLMTNLQAAIRPLGFENTQALSAARAKVKPIDLPANFTPYPLTLPRSFPLPNLPLDNPLTVERVELGKRLFHEPALSRNGIISCASCHQAEAGFSDPRRFSIGLDGKSTPRQSMSLLNLAWKDSFFWDGRAKLLRDQVLEPIENPIEMDEKLSRIPAKLAALPGYEAAFKAAFGTTEITPQRLGLALEAFLLTLVSTDSKFDQARQGKAQLTTEEQRGMELFFMEHEPAHGKRGADCFHCHGGPLFSDHRFHDNGLRDESDHGLGTITGNPSDRGKFATPGLRNISLTAPYMHDGRFATLEEVVAHYNTGVKRTPNLDPNLAKHPDAGLGLGDADQAALVAFLKTLTEATRDGSGKDPSVPAK